MVPTGQIVILVILLFFSAFFSGIETALMSLNRIKVNALLKQDKKGSQALFRIKQNSSRLIITILIGNNLVNIGAASLATIIFTNLFGSSGVGVATGVMTFLILVFGEITPKTYASRNAEKISLKVARLIEILSTILLPLIFLFEGISRVMSVILGGKKSGEEISEEELRTIVTMGAEEGILNREAASMMHNVLEFKGTRVSQVMTPNESVLMVEEDKKLKDVLDFIVKTPYSKYPIYSKTRDKITGILYVDEVLRYLKNKKISVLVKTISRKPFFVPGSKEIGELLLEFEKKKIQMAFVVDEYGAVSGVVTIEDILEEIVGDIFDKSKRGSVYIKKVSSRVLSVDAKVSVEEINKVLHLSLEEGHFNTLAGFIEHKLKKIPKRGEILKLKNISIEIVSATKQGIGKVRIIKN
jgi:putative hemolysin